MDTNTNESNLTAIYALVDPITNKVRYVGKSKNPLYRYKRHLIDAAKHNTYVRNWVSSLLAQNCVPTLMLIDIIEDWEEAEKFWIKFYRDAGCDLTNFTDGGEGQSGYKWTKEQRTTLSNAKIQFYKDPNARLKQSESVRRSYENSDLRIKRSQDGRKAASDPTVKAKRSATMQPIFQDPEYLNKLSVAHKLRWASMTPEEKSKIAKKGHATRKTNKQNRNHKRCAD